MPGFHMPLSASSAPQWVGCPGSVTMQLYYPPADDSDEALEGTASHEIASDMIEAASRAEPFPAFGSAYDGYESAEGVKFSREQYDGAAVFAEDCKRVMQRTGVFGGDGLRIEQFIHAARVHEQAGGTPDFSVWSANAGELVVSDYKYGFEIVEVEENWQLILYALALLEHYGVDGSTDEHVMVELRIVQPRAPHPEGPARSWRARASTLRGYANKLIAAAEEAMLPDPPVRTGRHCKHCSARLNCPAFTQATFSALDYEAQASPSVTTAHGVGLELRLVKRAIEILEQRESALEEEAIARAQQGETVPFWHMAPRYGRETWATDASEVFALGDLLGINLRKPAEALTPNQARAEAKHAGVDGSIIDTYSLKPKRGHKLVADDTSKAERIFNND